MTPRTGGLPRCKGGSTLAHRIAVASDVVVREHVWCTMAPPRLSIVFGPRRGVTLDVVRPLLVGRGPACDVHLLDDKVSREHCVFEPDGDRLSVRDLGSRNGTWVNGARIEGATVLAAEDTVGVGETLVLVADDALAQRALDGESTVVLAKAPLGLLTSAATPGADTLELAGKLVLEAALAPDAERAHAALTKAFATALECDEVVLCGRSPEGQLRPRAAFPVGAAVSLNTTFIEVCLTQGRTASVEEHQLRARHDAQTTTVVRQRAFVVCAPVPGPSGAAGVLCGVRTRPFDSKELSLAQVLAGTASASLRVEREPASSRPPLPPVVAESASMKAVVTQATRAAPTTATVLLIGESGTGKEAIARLVHATSKRAAAPFIALNCGAIPAELAESELFGHEKGAFTGAVATTSGAFERADGGTLFLDELGELPLPLQVKLLRVLEEKLVFRIGGRAPVSVDVRVVAATNRNLNDALEKGQFRADLYHRLNVVRLELEPLRSRPEDVVSLATLFLSKHAAALGRPAPSLTNEARTALEACDWPGNVRQLSNALERALVLQAEPGPVTLADLPPEVVSPRRTSTASHARTLGELVEALEREQILVSMKRFRGVKAQAAEALGISRPTLDRKLAEYGIDWLA